MGCSPGLYGSVRPRTRRAAADQEVLPQARGVAADGNVEGMCRNLTTLRGLEPATTSEEIEAAARQYVRKVSGVQSATSRTQEPFERAVALVAEATRALLAELPPRQQPPPTLPPLRRPGVKERERARQARAAAATH